ncbi:40S ribosomal protein S4-like [Hibiscus syriacus]|uniref:40S ribosomal protein S4-like n=1 Tax=Hibiscus syriacus TaxID=106335 RepID=UPI0019208FAA|nr:40S ribosomal protein S4-like [Hibiscus syriacus]
MGLNHPFMPSPVMRPRILVSQISACLQDPTLKSSVTLTAYLDTNEDFRLLYDTKGRFCLHAITGDETKFKLCKVRSVQFGQNGIPYLNTYDGRTIRYPDPLIKANDTIKLDLESNKIVDFIKFDVGNVVMVTGGRNRGRVGVIKNREKH